MGTINKNWCSACAPGCENYTSFTTKLRGKRVRLLQYDYREKNGRLFSCVGESLAVCRKKRDEWETDLKINK